MSQNRRKFMRISAADSDCTVQLGDAISHGVLINESISGMTVGNLELLILIADQKVIVDYDGEKTIGRCRSVCRNDNGLFQIGIYRETEEYRPEPTSILLNSFMRFDNCDIVCLPMAVLDEKRIRVRLMDGSEFVVNRDQLFQITRVEREQELRNDLKLQNLTRIYTAMDGSRQWYSREDVVNHEFGPPVGALV